MEDSGMSTSHSSCHGLMRTLAVGHSLLRDTGVETLGCLKTR